MFGRIPGALCASIALFSLFTGIAVAADPMNAAIIAIDKPLWQGWADAAPAAHTEAPAAE